MGDALVLRTGDGCEEVDDCGDRGGERAREGWRRGLDTGLEGGFLVVAVEREVRALG